MNDEIIHIAIVEDVDEIRNGLTALIDGAGNFRCVGAFPTAESALEQIPQIIPDIVLMDIHLPGKSGIECIRELKAQNPKLLILMLTVFEDDDSIFESLKAGASGYLLKKTPPVELLHAIQDVYSGGSPMSGTIARRVVQTFQQSSDGQQVASVLSKREQEILSYLAKGYRYKEIADTLFLSVETVRTHLRNIYDKLHVHSRTEAVLKYLKK
jgi:DNA-binding NarL/FixJ family response regulator